MKEKIIGKSKPRVDAYDKVTGKAIFIDDYRPRDMLVAKVLHSSVAHALIKMIHKEEALALEGVHVVLSFEDVEPIMFASAGHPYSMDPSHRDVADRYILSEKVRYVGDMIAVVVADDEVIARRALSLIKVDYEELPFVLDVHEALKEGAPELHESYPGNLLARSDLRQGELEEAFEASSSRFKGIYRTNIVQHAQMEPQSAYAYVNQGRLTVVSSTQIPHIARRILSEALNKPIGEIKVIKPYLGGGFGNKQDVILETLVSVCTLHCDGKPVKLQFDREEVFTDTRVRHAIETHLETSYSEDHKVKGLHLTAYSNTGAYASHGHSVLMASTAKLRPLYNWEALRMEPVTVYTNLPVAGAMRGYGSPQMTWAMECHMDDVAKALGEDPIAFRRKNLIEEGYEDFFTKNRALSFGAGKCLDLLEEKSDWKNRRKVKETSGVKRRGVGMALFSYGTGIYPSGIELAGVRISMNQDGSATLMVGATEIGQGSDTVLLQIAAETIGIPFEKMRIESEQNTDVTPFDSGAFASRQTYVSGIAVTKASREIREKILLLASKITKKNVEEIDLRDGILYDESHEKLMSLEDLMMQSFYHRELSDPIRADVSSNVQSNAFSYGASFCEIEVDMRTGKIEILDIFNVHDSGTIINPQLARGQVQGGMSMSLGQALMEDLIFDEKTGRCRNPNLLDYKLQTAMDSPEMEAYFVESFEPTSDYGQKALGEPPTLSPAPAIRNAFLHATGIAMNDLPMSQQKVFEALKANGLLQE